MSVNKYKPHLVVLPEDKAINDIMNGFLQCQNGVKIKQIEVMDFAGGWNKALEDAEKKYYPNMRQISQRHLLILIDFDNNPSRGAYARSKIPEDLNSRVFVMGVLSEPEPLKADLKLSLEAIGERLCNECADAPSPDAGSLWRHNLLKHNLPELARLQQVVAPFLF